MANFLSQLGTELDVRCFNKSANEKIRKKSLKSLRMIAHFHQQALAAPWQLRKPSIGILRESSAMTLVARKLPEDEKQVGRRRKTSARKREEQSG